MKYIVATCVTLLLSGCDFEVYRYACQDPDNWGSAECQKPLCEVSRTCPEHIFKNQSSVIKAVAGEPEPKTPQKQVSKGACK